MTEEEWLAASDSEAMVLYLGTKASDRKFRLFACACCRRVVWPHLVESSKILVDAAEQYADGLLDLRALGVIKGKASKALRKCNAQTTAFNLWVREVTRKPASSGVLRLMWFINYSNTPLGEQSDLARCIFGNPFRPIVADLAWLTPTVQSIAASIYRDRAFDRLPILADALEEAGCTNADVLLHCRQPGEHVRGCWVVDLVLGKA